MQSNRNIQHFNQIISTPTLMPLNACHSQSHQKENLIQYSSTSLQGTKALMYNYWEKNKKQSYDKSNKSKLSKTVKHQKSQNILPKIRTQNTDGRLGAYIRLKQKEKQLFIGRKQEEVQQQFHTVIKIEQYRIENDDKEFLKFQKRYYKRWEEILSLLKGFEKFAQHYKLNLIMIQTKLVFELIDKLKKGFKLRPHDFLNCCDNGQDISEMNLKKSGIRFYGKKGFIRAVIKIQSAVKKWIQIKKYKKMSLQWKSARIIQQFYKCRIMYKATKQSIFNKQMEKLQIFKKIQAEFIENYRKKQITQKIRYEVHIPSHNLSEWQKISSQKYIEKQNSELCRIFKIANKNPLHETRIIYVSPVVLPKEILNYFNKLFELGSQQEAITHRLTIVTPNANNKLPISMSPTQHLYYCPKTLAKIKKIINKNYAYIVPSTPSNDYILLCNQLNIPLYGNNPQKLSYLSTKSGCKYFQQGCEDSKEEEFGVLPYSINIYNFNNFLNELTNLIFRYPYIKRWILKIDNQINSRGIAYIDISKILHKSFLKKITIQNITKNQQKTYREQIYKTLENSLIINKEQKIVTLNKQIYPSQQAYLNYYFTRGGIIEASINNFETQLENTCFTINIQPDGQWKFISNYYKITNKHKAIAAYFDSNINKPSLSLYNIIQKLIKTGHFGYFTIQFLSIIQNYQSEKESNKIQNKLYYLNSIQCNLNEFSSAYYLKDFISKDSNALFIPILQHPCLLQLRVQTFFHLCRLQNISFDIQKKIGNIFLFLDGLQCGCIGMMTFNSSSKANCFTHSAEVLEFLNSKLKNNLAKDIPKTFLSIKNAINGYLNRTKKIKLALKHSQQSTKIIKSLNNSQKYVEDNHS